MALSKAEQRARYPLAVYNFRVSVDGVDMAFSEVSGLHREHQVATYRHGLSFAEGEDLTKYRLDRYVSLTLKRGTVLASTVPYAWLEGKELSSMDINLCDEEGTPVIGWHVAKAIAVKLEAPTFDASASGVSVETLEVKAAGISIRELD